MEFILSVAITSIEQVWLTLLHNWPYLAVSVVIAALLKLFVNAEKVSAFLNRHRGASVVAATAAAVATPLCSCGTTAVILGMMASRMPWAPIVAFMVASPLTSPEGLVYSAGLFGWPFALAFYLASIVLGLAGGWGAAAIESRGWLANQARLAESVAAPCARPATTRATAVPNRVLRLAVPDSRLSAAGTACGCAEAAPIMLAASCGGGQVETLRDWQEPGAGCAVDSSSPAQCTSQVARQQNQVTSAMFLNELYRSGRQLLVMFVGFAFIGYFLNGLIPTSWVAAVFGGGNIYNVPLAATLGLPLYVNSEASLPLVRALLDNGMSQGAALAFLIAGAGTSIGAITGALTIARWRVIALVVGTLWVGAIVSGYAFNLALPLI
ncbi:MAG TPA: permease [Roseiflexaceae bacterium]|nr:permease [Roseiflexaceae bacterium]